MRKAQFYHGGKAGLEVGDLLVPSPPHVDDGCLVCVARREGRIVTAGEYRAWLRQFGARAEPALRALEGAPDNAPIDPPSAERAVYVTTSIDYARWYAARSRGDLYRVAPAGALTVSTEDHFDSFTVPAARIVEVIQRRVVLDRRERRRLGREWQKADQRAERERLAPC